MTYRCRVRWEKKEPLGRGRVYRVRYSRWFEDERDCLLWAEKSWTRLVKNGLVFIFIYPGWRIDFDWGEGRHGSLNAAEMYSRFKELFNREPKWGSRYVEALAQRGGDDD